MVKKRKMFSSPKCRDPDHWGKKTWDALFLLASDFPHERECDEDTEYHPSTLKKRKESWRSLLRSLPGVITCGSCSDHFKDFVEKEGRLEDALLNRDTLFEFLYQAKDEVNKRRGRKSLSLRSVKRIYIPKCSKKKKQRRKATHRKKYRKS